MYVKYLKHAQYKLYNLLIFGFVAFKLSLKISFQTEEAEFSAAEPVSEAFSFECDGQ